MDYKYDMSDVYRDFFETPLVELDREQKENEPVAFDLEVIDSLRVTEESQELLKKIVRYMRKVVDEKNVP